MLGVDDTTVGDACRRLEAIAGIPQCDTVIKKNGATYPARRPRTEYVDDSEEGDEEALERGKEVPLGKFPNATVAAVSDELEGLGEIPQVDTVTDTMGRQYPARRPAQAAKKAFQRYRVPRLGTFRNKEILIPVCPPPLEEQLLKIDYQKAGAGERSAVAWCDASVCPEPEAFLKEKLGSLASFTVTRSAVDPGPPIEQAPDPLAALTTIAVHDDLDIPFDVPPVGAWFPDAAGGAVT